MSNIVCFPFISVGFEMGQFSSTFSLRSGSNNNLQKPQISHVIFDLDGTLIDSEASYFKLQVSGLRKFGKEFTLEQKRALLGRTTEEEVRELIRMHNLQNVVSVSDYLKMYETMYVEYLSDCSPMPGTEKLIQHLHANKIPMAICTNSRAEHYVIKMHKNFLHWLKMIPLAVFAASDPQVKRPKPFPDSYILTMERFASKPRSPNNVLVFEDSITGAHAAIEAGCSVILIPQMGFCKSEEMETEINIIRPQLTAVLKSMEEFVPEDYGLPAFK
ncbi:Pseudouridine-5'-monophosphatase [Aphelenchoides besseyi]|nr:Pseudouridine-5'-monophosphatase [Aphelenchoides besseyi]